MPLFYNSLDLTSVWPIYGIIVPGKVS